MKRLFFLYILLLTATQPAFAKSEFEKVTESYTVFSKNLANLNLESDKTPADPKPTIESLNDFQSKITLYSIKEINRSYILQPLQTTKLSLQRLQNSRSATLKEKAKKYIVTAKAYFKAYPVLKALETESKILLGYDRLLSKKFAAAEDFLNESSKLLRQLTKSQPAKIKTALLVIENDLETILLTARREEEIDKLKAKAILTKINKAFAQAHMLAQKEYGINVHR